MKRLCLLMLSFFWIIYSLIPIYANETDYTENDIKAAFLYNFTKFVEWPETTAANNSFTIGILGDNNFGDILELSTRGKTVYGKVISVHKINDLEKISSCRMLYIGSSCNFPPENIQSILLVTPGILTISNSDNFLQNGGMIHLYLLNNRMRFEINLKAAKKSGLKISSKLLGLATRVDT